jgi:hypothetical protein
MSDFYGSAVLVASSGHKVSCYTTVGGGGVFVLLNKDLCYLRAEGLVMVS